MKHPPKFSFTRLVRTSNSESHVIRQPTDNPDSNDNVGSLNLHFEGRLIHGTLVLEVQLNEEELDHLIDQMTDQLVPTERDDFIFTVYLGTEIGYYSDSITESERSTHTATKADVDEIRQSLAKVIGNHQLARGKLAEHATCAYFKTLGYTAERAGPSLDAMKIDVVAQSDSEVVYAQTKLGAISSSEMRKIVAAVATFATPDPKQSVVAIIAKTFPRDSEKRRRELEAEFFIPVMCIQTYQIAEAAPEYRQSLGV